MKLIVEQINSNYRVLTEGEGDSKNLFIEGIFMQAEAKNRNGRIYPKTNLEAATNYYVAEYVQKKRALGELNHPESSTVNLDKVSHIITDLRFEGNDVVGKAKILRHLPMGKIAAGLIEEGVSFGVSSRAVGSILQEETDDGEVDVVQDDLILCAVDIVADPSAPKAFVRGILEGKEYVWSNGILKEAEVSAAKKAISKVRKEEAAIKIASRLLEKLNKF